MTLLSIIAALAVFLFTALIRQAVLTERAEDRADRADAALARVSNTVNECAVDAALAINPTGAAKVLADARTRIGARIDAEDFAKFASAIDVVSK